MQRHIFRGIDCTQLVWALERWKHRYGEEFNPFAHKRTPVLKLEDLRDFLRRQKEKEKDNKKK